MGENVCHQKCKSVNTTAQKPKPQIKLWILDKRKFSFYIYSVLSNIRSPPLKKGRSTQCIAKRSSLSKLIKISNELKGVTGYVR